MTKSARMVISAVISAVASVTAYGDVLLNFDSLANGTVVTDQFRGNGVLFDELTVIAQGTLGVDGSASFPNTVLPSNTANSVFDGKTASEITAQYGIAQQHGFGEAFVDVLFVIDGTNTPGVTNSVSAIVGFDQIFGTNEVNRIVIEAFDSDFSLIGFDVSPRLVIADSATISVTAPGIRGVRLTHSDALTLDDFRFGMTTIPVPSPVPEPSTIGFLLLAALAITTLKLNTKRLTITNGDTH